MAKFTKSDEKRKKTLPAEGYRVLQESGTERALRGRTGAITNREDTCARNVGMGYLPPTRNFIPIPVGHVLMRQSHQNVWEREDGSFLMKNAPKRSAINATDILGMFSTMGRRK